MVWIMISLSDRVQVFFVGVGVGFGCGDGVFWFCLFCLAWFVVFVLFGLVWFFGLVYLELVFGSSFDVFCEVVSCLVG